MLPCEGSGGFFAGPSTEIPFRSECDVGADRLICGWASGGFEASCVREQDDEITNNSETVPKRRKRGMGWPRKV